MSSDLDDVLWYPNGGYAVYPYLLKGMPDVPGDTVALCLPGLCLIQSPLFQQNDVQDHSVIVFIVSRLLYVRPLILRGCLKAKCNGCTACLSAMLLQMVM